MFFTAYIKFAFAWRGGISIKPSANMDAMRGDMGGAAATLGAFVTIAKLKLPINIRGQYVCVYVYIYIYTMKFYP